MAGEEDLCGADAIPLDGSPQRSRVAQALARWANFSYWLALALAVFSLLGAAAFAALSPEPAGPRLMSLVFLGFFPAITACSMGLLVYCALKGTSAIYDPVATALLSLTFRTLTDAALIARRFLVWLATEFLPRWVRKVMAFAGPCRHAVERARRVISFYVAIALAAYARVLMAVVRHVAYRALIACLGTSAAMRACGRAIARAPIGMLRAALDAATTLIRAIGACMEFASARGRAAARLFALALRYSRAAGRTCIMGATFPVRLVARILIRLLPSGEQITAMEAVAVTKVDDDPQHPKSHDSNHLGVDQTGIIVPMVLPARVHEVSPRNRDEFLVSVVPCGRGLRVALVTSVLVAASVLGWIVGSNLYRFLDPKGRELTIKAAVNSVIERIIAAESNGDPNAKNKRSSATGAGQFIDETWLDMIRAHRPDLAARSEKEKLELRRDPELARQITARFAEQNAAMLNARGLPVTPSTLYLSHFAGRAGAVAILSAPENADAASIMASADATGRTTREKIVKANPFLEGFTVADLKSWVDRKMRGLGSSAGATRSAGTGKSGAIEIH